jgi:hypothetical protein
MMAQDIKKSLSELMEKYGDQEVAESIGVGVRMLYKYKNNESEPRDRVKKLIAANYMKLQEGAVNLRPVTVNGKSHEAPVSYSQPIQDRYISLLEQTLKEKKDELIELKARINDLEGKQRDFLARVESSIERYEHLVLAQLQSKGQPVPDSTPTVLQQTYKSRAAVKKRTVNTRVHKSHNKKED